MKFSSIFATIAMLLASTGCSSAPSGRADGAGELQTVASVDLQKYLGKWYEIARYPNRFERGCTNVTAEYSIIRENRVAVRNSCFVGSKSKVANGTAVVIEGSNGARLAVNFAPFPLPLGDGNYHILHIGGDYQTALVGEPSGRFLWMLARTPVVTNAQRHELEQAATKNGYDLQLIENVIQRGN